jgi:hypothetical protein
MRKGRSASKHADISRKCLWFPRVADAGPVPVTSDTPEDNSVKGVESPRTACSWKAAVMVRRAGLTRRDSGRMIYVYGVNIRIKDQSGR